MSFQEVHMTSWEVFKWRLKSHLAEWSHRLSLEEVGHGWQLNEEDGDFRPLPTSKEILEIFLHIHIHNLSVFENLTSSSSSDNYCISIFIDNGHIWRGSSTIWYFRMCQIFLINIEESYSYEKNYLLKLNVYATGHLFWYTTSQEHFPFCSEREPSISPELWGCASQSRQIKME